MDPLLASDPMAAAALGTANTHRIATPAPAEWTEAMAGAAAPQAKNPIAPAAAKQTDGAARDFSVADAVARATTQLAVSPAGAAKTDAAAPAGTRAEARPDGAITSLRQQQALMSAASDAAASPSLGATGRRSAAADRPRSSSLSKTVADRAPRPDRQTQFAAQPEDRLDRGTHAIETDSGDGSKAVAETLATPQPAGTNARRSTKASLEEAAADRVTVSSPAAAAVTAAVLTPQPPQTSVILPGGLPSVPAMPAASTPGSVATASRSTAGGGLGDPTTALSHARLDSGATPSSSTDPRTQTPEVSPGAKASDDTEEAALAEASDPVATTAMAQPSGESAPAATQSTLSGSALPATAMPLGGKAAPGLNRGADPSGADAAKTAATETVRPAASATVTSAASPSGSKPPAPTTAAPQLKAVDSVSPSSPRVGSDGAMTTQAAQAAQTVSQPEATNVAATVAPASPLQATPDGSPDVGRKAGSPRTAATTTAATTTAARGVGTAALSAAASTADAAGSASAADGPSSTADRVDDAASRPGRATRSASAAATTPSAGGTTIARPSTQVAMTVMPGSAVSAGTPASPSGLITGGQSTGSQSTGSQSTGTQATGITPAVGGFAGGASPTTPLYLFDGGSRCIMIRIGPVG
jgi:hypothetical protein